MQRSTCRARARLRLVPVLAGVAALVAACLPLNTQETYLLEQVNALRSERRLEALHTHDPLVERARWWAGVLAERGELRHSDLRTLSIGWSMVGENVGRGGSIEAVHEALTSSGSHRSTMLEAGFTHVGMGTARGDDGRIYVVQVFWRG